MDNINIHYISYGIIVLLFFALHIIIRRMHIFLSRKYTNLDDKKLLELYKDENIKSWFYNLGNKKIVKGSIWNKIELTALVNTMREHNLDYSGNQVYDFIKNRNNWSESFKKELMKEICVCLIEKERHISKGVILVAFTLFFAASFV